MVNRYRDQQSANGTDEGPFSLHQITQWACREQYQKSAQNHQVPPYTSIPRRNPRQQHPSTFIL